MSLTPSRPGQVNGAGSDRALYLQMFAGEVLTAFEESNVAASRFMTRSIQHGKSASFPATWKAAASYHTPGTLITGQSINGNERVITIDDLLISPVSIANIDEAMVHFDIRSIYAKECGASLARTFDRNVLQVAVKAARATATVTGGNGGTRIVNAQAGTTAAALIAATEAAATAFDQKDVPESDRVLFLQADEYYRLIGSGSNAIHTDFNPGGNGSLASGKVYRLFGFEIVKTNHLPSTNITTGPTAYQGDFTGTVALAAHRSAVGTVKLIDMSVESDYLVQYQAWLTVAKMAVGHGILRPESAVEIATV